MLLGIIAFQPWECLEIRWTECLDGNSSSHARFAQICLVGAGSSPGSNKNGMAPLHKRSLESALGSVGLVRITGPAVDGSPSNWRSWVT